MIWAVALRFWKPLVAAVGVILLIALYRSQINSAVERGRAECEAATAARIANEREEAQARVDEADARAAAASGQINRTEVRYVDRIKAVVRDGPCLDASSVREIRAADRALAESASVSAGTVPHP